MNSKKKEQITDSQMRHVSDARLANDSKRILDSFTTIELPIGNKMVFNESRSIKKMYDIDEASKWNLFWEKNTMPIVESASSFSYDYDYDYFSFLDDEQSFSSDSLHPFLAFYTIT